ANDQVDLESSESAPTHPVRVRITLLPSQNGKPRLHVKGLNCFIVKPGARPSGAVDLEDDTSIELMAPDRRLVGFLRCDFGRAADDARLFALRRAPLAVP